MSRRPPVHPLVLAAYPVVFLYGENLGEASAGDLILPLGLVLGGTIVLYGFLRLLLGTAGRAALAASLIVIGALEYDRVATALARPRSVVAGCSSPSPSSRSSCSS